MASGPNNHQQEPTLASDEIQTISDTNPSNIIMANNNENENIDTNDVTIGANSSPETIASIDKQVRKIWTGSLQNSSLRDFIVRITSLSFFYISSVHFI